jgi:putative tryptophan/tyrosine transport system substrate-binding protein
MNRREVIAGLAFPLLARGARAQPSGKVWRLGYLAEGTDPRVQPRTTPAFFDFFDGLRDLGYVEGRNLAVEFRFAEGKPERLPQLATELVALKPDVIAAPGTRESLALQKATTVIPIIMVYPGDPVGAGLVASLANPGANITGTSLMFPDVGGKRLELLREIVPSLRRVAILGNPNNASTAADMRATEATAVTQGLAALVAGVESPDRLDERLGEIAAWRPDGLLVFPDTLIVSRRQRIVEFALKNGIVTVCPSRSYVESGGLIGYGPSMGAVGRRAATYVDKILKGAKPTDLPVEQPTKFDLVVNLKTARQLGLTIPESFLIRADEVIE